MKPLTYGSICSGVECMSAASIGLPLKPAFFAEVEPYPCAVLRSKFPHVPNLGDITKIKYDAATKTLTDGRHTVDLSDGLDILAGGTPCFVAGTLVLTPSGYRPIEDLKVGDEVVGGITGEVRRVEAVGSKMAKVGKLKILGRPEITCTPNHPFYCIDVKRDNRRKSATYTQMIPQGDYQKVHAEDAVGKYAGRVKLPEVLTEHETPKVGSLTRAEVMNLAGWYVGDGYIRRWQGKNKKVVVFALVSKEKIEKFRSLYEGKFNFSVSEDGKISLCCTKLADWLFANFGEHATDKFISYWVYSDTAKQDFLDGYLATDGCTDSRSSKFLTVSPRLAYGIADLVGYASVSIHRVPPKGIIMGREVNQHDNYTVQCPNEGIRTKLINGRYASIIRNYNYDGTTTARVFNITVSDEHAYVAEGLCVGNCQDFSCAGKRAGADSDDLSDGGTTRSSLIFTYIRLLREIQPRYCLYENVPGLFTSNEGRDFCHFLVALAECGYCDVAWRVLDAQYVRVDGMERAVPQRRRRVWLIGRLGENYGGAAKILLERDGNPGDLPPRRKTREEIAAGIGRWLALHGGMVGEAGRGLCGGIGDFGGLLGELGGGLGGGCGGVGAFNFELWANPPRNLIDALCARRAGDWMVADKTQGVDSYNQTTTGNCAHPIHAIGGTIDAVGGVVHAMPQGYRAGSFGQCVADGAAGTLDCGHMAGVGNGTPCLVTDKPATAPVASFDPFEPGGIKGQCVRTTGEANTLVNGTCPGHHNAIVQRVTNSNGGDVAPTLTASIRSHTEQQMERGGGYVIEHVTNSNGENVAPCLTTELAHQTGNHQLHSGGYVIEKTTNSNGGDVMPTIMASEYKQLDSQKDKGGGYIIATFENHQSGDQNTPHAAEVAPTMGASHNASCANNNPLVVATVHPTSPGASEPTAPQNPQVFAKVSHPRGKDGDGERWAQSNVAGTRNVFDGERAQEVVVEKPQTRPAVCVAENIIGRADNAGGNGVGAQEGVSYTLDTIAPHAVCYDGYNQRAHDELCMTLRSAATGAEGNDADPKVCVPTADNGGRPKSTCLTPGDPIAKRVYTADGAAPTLQAIAEGSGISAQAFVLPPSADDLPRVIVRRLTPTECERLMGLPSGWTRVTFTPEQIADDALVEDFRRIHDAFAQMVAKPGTTPKPKTAKFVRDWLTRISDPATCPDAPRYKACGNGWAANCPRWILFNLLEFDHPHWQDEWFSPSADNATANAVQVVGMKHNAGATARSMGESENLMPTIETDCGIHQSIATTTAFAIDSLASNSMKSANPNSGCHETNVSKCLDTATPDPSRNQGGDIIVENGGGGASYGINTQGGMNPCFKETSETLMTCHTSGVLIKRENESSL